MKRRIVVGGLVLLSLVLITLSFRSSALDGVQGTAADGLRPFEIAADRVSRPFQDAIGWSRGLVDAKSNNAKLKKQVAALRQQLYIEQSALEQNKYLKQQLDFHGAPSIADFDRVNAEVLTGPSSASDQSITIATGSAQHVVVGDVVITPYGLVGTISKAFSHVSRVTLLTDEQSAVASRDTSDPTAVGIVQRGNASSDVLIMDRVSPRKRVLVGDTIVTNGSLGSGKFPSMFPRGIQIGTVTSASLNDINPFQNVQIKPFVDFSSLQSVIVLVPRTP